MRIMNQYIISKFSVNQLSRHIFGPLTTPTEATIFSGELYFREQTLPYEL
jgi:hypothetical protein